MTRAILIVLGLLGLAVPRSAGAETTLHVIGPAIDSKIPAARVKLIEEAMTKAAVGKRSDRAIDTLCVADTLCLIGHGEALKADRVLAIAASPSGAGTTFTFVLVDIASKELIAKRDVAIADAKLVRNAVIELRKFVDEGPIERSKALFERGNQHYNLGEFAIALDNYKRAYRVKALPAFLFNIAQCHRKLDQHREAVAMYQSYLVGVPDAPNKKMVESLITESKGKLAEEARLSEQTGKAKSEAEKLEIERKRAEAERQAKEADARAAAERTKVEQARIAAQRERDLDKQYNRHPARKWALVVGGLGAGAAVAGGVFGLSARSAQSSFDAAGCGDPMRFLGEEALARCTDDRDRGERNARLSNILIGGGGALLVTSVIIFAVDPGNVERPRQPRAQLRISPSSVQVVVRW